MTNFGPGLHYDPLDNYEYGIDHVRYPTLPHRWGMTREEAENFVRDWEEDGGKSGVFSVIRRPVGSWERVNYND